MGNVLEMKNAGCRRGWRKEWLLDGVELTVAAGERAGVFGISGSGKTVLAELASGLRRPDRGTVEHSGSALLVTQEFSWYQDLTVKENLEFCRLIHGDDGARLPRIVAAAGLDGWEGTRASRLPAGLRPMLQIACALVGGADLVVLDDPSRGLDKPLRGKLGAILDQWRLAGTAVLVCTSDEALAARCETVYHLNRRTLSRLEETPAPPPAAKEATR